MEGAPSRSSSSLRLPLNLSSFIGREVDIAQVAPLILTHRVVTLTGSGGAGKTRLALEVAGRLAPEFANGVRVVEFASLADPALVADSVAQVLGLLEPAGTPALERLSAYLHERNLLLLLDNCEHLIEACAEFANSLLRNCCSDLRILATSREPLGVPGEIAWRVPPLPAPPAEVVDDPRSTNSYDAVRLFVERAREAAADFALSPENVRTVSAICRRLDGMPLAIELAAARTKVLTLEQIEARLEDALVLLAGGGRGAVPRHRTMRVAIDWSYRLLADRPAAIFRRLAVFSGGCTLDAAASICADVVSGPHEALEIIAELVDKSLMVARTQGAEMRYHLLEVIRQFAVQELRARGEENAARQRHLDYYLALAEQIKPRFRLANPVPWLERLDLEHDNLRAALEFALAHADESPRHGEAALRLASALEPYWRLRNHYSEGCAWLSRALATKEAASNAILRGRALMNAVNLGWQHGGSTPVRPLAEESVAIFREMQPQQTRDLAAALRMLGMLRWATGDSREARAILEESFSLFRSLDDERGVADVIWNIGGTLLIDDPTLARELNERAIAIYDRLRESARGPRYQLANLAMLSGDYTSAREIYEGLLAESRKPGNLLALGRLARLSGNLGAAEAYYRESIVMLQDYGASTADEDHGLAHVMVAHGNLAEARALFLHSLEAFQRAGDDRGVAACLVGFAHLKCALRRYSEAARLLAAAESVCDRVGGRLYAHDLADWERGLKMVRDALDAPTLETAWAEGRALSLEAAINLGAELPTSEPAPPTSALTPLRATKAQFGGLTAREREIAACVASGKSNHEIADELVVSERTVEAHIGNILSKLEFTSRTQIATWALQKGLLRTDS